MSKRKETKRETTKFNSFLLDNEKRFHSGLEIKNEIERCLMELPEDCSWEKGKVIRTICQYMNNKFIYTKHPIKDEYSYRVTINRHILCLSLNDLLELNLNSQIKILRNKNIGYSHMKVTQNKYFLDFIKFMKGNKRDLECFALIQYESGERILCTESSEVRKYIDLTKTLEENFGLYDYIIPTIDNPTHLLISKPFLGKVSTEYLKNSLEGDAATMRKYGFIIKALRSECQIEIFDASKKYKY